MTCSVILMLLSSTTPRVCLVANSWALAVERCTRSTLSLRTEYSCWCRVHVSSCSKQGWHIVKCNCLRLAYILTVQFRIQLGRFSVYKQNKVGQRQLLCQLSLLIRGIDVISNSFSGLLRSQLYLPPHYTFQILDDVCYIQHIASTPKSLTKCSTVQLVYA